MDKATIFRPEDLLAESDAATVARVCEMMCRLVRCGSEQEFFRELPGSARDLFEADCAWIALIEGDEVVLRTQSGLRRSDMAQRWRMKFGEGISGTVAKDGQPTLMIDYRQDPRRRPEIEGIVDREGIRGGMSVPVYRGKNIVGVMTLGSYQVNRFGRNDLKILVAFMAMATRVATSIHKREVAILGRVKAESDLAELRNAGGIELAMAEEIVAEAGLGRALVRLAQWLDAPVSLRDKAGHILAAAGQPDEKPSTRIAMVGDVANEMDLLVHDDERMTSLQRDVCNRCAGLLTIAVLRERSRFQAELRIRSELFDELLDGRITNPQDMLLRSALVGVDLEVPRVVVCLAARGPTASADVFAPRLVNKVQKFMLDHVRDGIATIRNGRITLLLAAPPDATGQERLDLGRALLDNLRPYIDTRQLGVGVGRVCHSIEDYQSSFNEADITSRQIALGKVDKPVALVEDLGLFGVLALSTGGASLERLVTEKLGPLLEADEASRSAHVKTLRTFFEHDRHLERTAKALFIHVNTLRYRLERIQELLNVDLRDSRNRFLLELAVYADRVGETQGESDVAADLDGTSRRHAVH